MNHRPRILVLTLAAALAACGDPKPAAPVGPVAGAPISGAPIDAPVAPTASAPAEPAVGDLGPNVPAPVPAPATPPVPEPSAGDTAVRAPDAAPTPTLPSTPPVAEPAPVPPTVPVAPPVAETVPPETARPIPPTTASQADKPTLPDRPADPNAPATSAAAPVKTPGKGFIPKGHKKGDTIELTFEQLASFDYTPPPLPPVDSDTPPPDPSIAIEATRKQIPAEIWELEGETVSVEGYMIPLEYADEGVKAFLISRHAMGCCFGIMPRAHELIECDLGEGKSTPYVGYLPVKVTGVLRVGPKEGAPTVLSGIYRMDSPKVTIPKEQ